MHIFTLPVAHVERIAAHIGIGALENRLSVEVGVNHVTVPVLPTLAAAIEEHHRSPIVAAHRAARAVD